MPPLTGLSDNWSNPAIFEIATAKASQLFGRLPRRVMTINSDQFQEICNSVWRDRAMVLQRRGFLTGEAALMRAVYWRLSKAGIRPILSAENYGSSRTVSSYQLGISCVLEIHGRPLFKGAQFLDELVQRYKNELRESC